MRGQRAGMKKSKKKGSGGLFGFMSNKSYQNESAMAPSMPMSRGMNLNMAPPPPPSYGNMMAPPPPPSYGSYMKAPPPPQGFRGDSMYRP